MLQVVENKMEPLQFCYWLQGFAELNSGVPPNDMQWKAIRDHLALVFEKKTPPYNVPMPRSTDYTPEPARVWYQGNTVTQPYTVTCGGTQSNTQSYMVC